MGFFKLQTKEKLWPEKHGVLPTLLLQSPGERTVTEGAILVSRYLCVYAKTKMFSGNGLKT